MGIGSREDPLPEGVLAFAVAARDGGRPVAAARRAHDAAAIAARMARVLGLPDADVRFVHYVALVHGHPAAEVPGLVPLGDALRHVSEHFDGTGGPDGLAGQQIPLASRIARVAAEYVRCRHGDPLAVLRPRAGTRLDPAAVDALAGVLRAHAA
jgi:HD-GYP domain-containing protein (c-di-GMP phosphodiesterase class II)